jgi:hypothetical protein
MVFTFDTLGYSKHLRDAGVPVNQAEAHAEAARDYVMHEIVTKADLALALDNLTLRLTIRMGTGFIAATTIIIATLSFVLKH